MKEGLFRDKARQAYLNRLDGKVLIASDAGHWWITGIFLTVVAAIGLFFVFADYTPKSAAVGALVPQAGIAKVFPSAAGIVTELLVEDGDIVQAGDPLMTVSYQNSLFGGQLWGEAWLDETERLIASLETERDMIEQAATAEANIIRQQMSAADLTHDQLTAESEGLGRQLDNATERFASRQSLARQGVISTAVLRSEEDELTSLQSAVRVKEIEIARNQVDRASLDFQLTQVEQNLARSRAQLDREILSIRQTSIERRSQISQTIAAPVSGRVTTLLAETGSPVMPAAPVLSLLPLWSLLEAEVYIPAAAIGFVSLGQTVDIKFPSFPHQRYGTFRGEVTYISETTLQPGDTPATAGFQTPTYRLRVEIAEQNVITRDGVFPMLPGMGVEIDLIGHPISVFDWVMKPIQDVTGRFE